MSHRKINIILGAVLFAAWASLYLIYLFTDDGSYLAFQIFLFIFLAPFFWGFISALLGDARVSSLKMFLESFFGFIGKGIAVIIIALMALTGGGVFVYQTYHYLKTGIWNSVSIIDGMRELGSTWASNPIDWHGIWKILNAIPLSLSLLVIAFLSYLVYLSENDI